MKSIFVGAALPLLFSVLAVSGISNQVQASPSPKSAAATLSDLMGTWRIVSYKYGDEAKFTAWPKDQVMLKHMTATHFTWATYDAKTGKVSRMAGGTYSFKNNEYVENLQYGMGDDVTALIGKPQKFTDQVDGAQWHHSGLLSQGLKIEEKWERVK